MSKLRTSNPKWDQIPVIFPPQRMTDGIPHQSCKLTLVLAEWLGKKGIKQCHIAETVFSLHRTC